MAPLFPWTVWATKLVIEVVAHYSLRLAILGLVPWDPELLRHDPRSLLVGECVPHALRHVDHPPAHGEVHTVCHGLKREQLQNFRLNGDRLHAFGKRLM